MPMRIGSAPKGVLCRRDLLIGGACGALFGSSAAARTAAQWYVPSRYTSEVRIGRDCLVVADRRIFAVMAFINASGFDDEAAGQQMHPVRLEARRQLAERLSRHAEQYEAFRRFYAAAALSNADWIEYAITLTPDYPFRKVGPNDGIFHDYTPKRLAGFPELLNRFCRVVQIDKVWEALKPQFIADLAKYDLAGMNGDLDFVWAYARMPRREARTMVSTPNLLDRHFSAVSVACGRYFVSVEGPGSHNYGLNIHEYLHEIANPITRRNYPIYEAQLRPYFERWVSSPQASGYDKPVVFVQECLVRALDARVTAARRPERAEAKRQEVEWSAKQGFSLALPFFERLAQFEQGGDTLEAYAPALFDGLGGDLIRP